MKRIFTSASAALLALGTLWSHTAQARDQVGVTVSVRQPGFYGRVEIGNDRPAPQVVYPQPVIVQQTPVAVVQSPIYMRVPPGHHRHWARYCARYRACGQPVYFVAAPVVVPAPYHGGPAQRYDQRDHDEHHDHGRWHGRGHGRHGDR
jgi:hypothetical protein